MLRLYDRTEARSQFQFVGQDTVKLIGVVEVLKITSFYMPYLLEITNSVYPNGQIVERKEIALAVIANYLSKRLPTDALEINK